VIDDAEVLQMEIVESTAVVDPSVLYSVP